MSDEKSLDVSELGASATLGPYSYIAKDKLLQKVKEYNKKLGGSGFGRRNPFYEPKTFEPKELLIKLWKGEITLPNLVPGISTERLLAWVLEAIEKSQVDDEVFTYVAQRIAETLPGDLLEPVFGRMLQTLGKKIEESVQAQPAS